MKSTIRKKIKIITYNNPPELLIAIFLLLITVIHFIIHINIVSVIFSWVLLIVVSIFSIYNLLKNIKYKNNYFKINNSKISKYKWINQRKYICNNKNSCPLKELIQNFKKLEKAIANNIIYKTLTHEIIYNHIKKSFEVVESEYVGEKSLKMIKKTIRNKKCDKCKYKGCILKEENSAAFYAISFKLR